MITTQIPIIYTKKAATSDAELQLIREMGIDNVDLNFGSEYCNYDDLKRILDHLAKFGLKAGNLSCMPLQKNKTIILGKDGRDEEIAKYIELIKLADKVDVRVVSVAWQPNGILRTGRAIRACSYGALTGYVEMDEIEKRDIANDRVYDETEIWDNFKYFLDRTIPVCEAHNVRMALHPNDPPVSSLAGVASLIYNKACYDKAFSLAHESKALSMKMCIGCWLEGGELFGDLMNDIEEYVRRDKITVVHFRNVSSTIPNFDETLAEDGYANMYAIMKKLVECGYDGLLSVDHVFSPASQNIGTDKPNYVIVALDQDKNDNTTMRYAYPTGYAKGLLHAAQMEVRMKHGI